MRKIHQLSFPFKQRIPNYLSHSLNFRYGFAHAIISRGLRSKQARTDALTQNYSPSIYRMNLSVKA
jgi:hypothetical protein